MTTKTLAMKEGAMCRCGCRDTGWIATCGCGATYELETCAEGYAWQAAQDWWKHHRCD